MSGGRGLLVPRVRARDTAMRAERVPEGVSLEDMIKIAKQREAACDGPYAGADALQEAVADGRAVFDMEVVAELPCVFTGEEQPVRGPGDEIGCNFFDLRYQKAWQYAKSQTGGAFAIRYKKGNLQKSDQVFGLWPASDRGHGLLGLSLGLYACSVVTVHPFPIVRLLAPVESESSRLASIDDPLAAELHLFLRSLKRDQQRAAMADMEPRFHRSLMRWLASGGASSLGDIGKMPR